MYRKIGAGVLILMALIAAGCGSGNSSSGSSSSERQKPAALSKAEYIKQANAVCTAGLKEKDEAVRKALEEGSQSRAAEEEAGEMAAQAALPTFRSMVEQLGELRAPAKEKSQVDQIIGRYEAALKQAEAKPASLVSGNPFVKADKAAISYGLEACNA